MRSDSPALPAALGARLQPPLVLPGVPWTVHHRQYLHIAYAWLAVALFGVLVVLWRGADAPALDRPVAFAVLGGVLLLVAAGRALARRQAAQRMEVVRHAQGLVVQGAGGARVLPYSELRSFWFTDTPVLFNGRLQGHSYRLCLQPREGPALRLPGYGPTGAPLQALLSAVQRGCVAAARERLATGGRVAGRGWRLDADGLQVRAALGARWSRVRTAEVGRAAPFGLTHVYWRAGGSRPFLRVPQSSPNALLLFELVTRALPAVAPAPPPHGHLLTERSDYVPAAVAFGLFALGCVYALFLLIDEGASPWGAVFGFAVLAPLSYGFGRMRVRIYEQAVSVRSALGERTLRLDELAAFRVESQVASDSGLYVGAALRLHLRPLPGRGKPVAFGMPGPDAMAEAEALRERLVALLLPRLRQLLEDHGRLSWAPRVFITPEGVESEPTPATAPRVLLPWRSLQRGWEGGKLQLWSGREPAARLELSERSENFHVGLRLVEQLQAEAALRGALPRAGSRA